MRDLLAVACKLLVAAYRIYFPDQGFNSGPLHWEHGVSAPGPPGKSLDGPFRSLPFVKWEMHGGGMQTSPVVRSLDANFMDPGSAHTVALGIENVLLFFLILMFHSY